jgi:E3 ubiquitin-protein ligase DMA1/2
MGESEEWMRSIGKVSGSVAENQITEPSAATQSLPSGRDTAHTGSAVQGYDDTGDLDLTDTQFDTNADETAPTPQMTPSVGQFDRPRSTMSDTPDSSAVNGIDMLRSISAAQLVPISSGEAIRSSRHATPTSIEITGEGPMTPRNNAGPFVLDGSAGRGSDDASVPGGVGAHAVDRSALDRS